MPKKPRPAPAVRQLPLASLDPAPWNYKAPATPGELDRLRASIERDRSAGVLAVRRVGKRYEVIDGNHRLEVLRAMGREEAWVEDFGPLSQAEAVLLSRRRNTQWFADDTAKLVALFAGTVLPEIPAEEVRGVVAPADADVLALLADAPPPPAEGDAAGDTPEARSYNPRVNVPADEETARLWGEIVAAKAPATPAEVMAWMVRRVHKSVVRASP